MVSPKKINRKRTLLLPMIEEISESKPGLRFFIAFYPNYDWIEVGGTMSYFKIDNQMHGWIERNLNR